MKLTEEKILENKERFISIFNEFVKREGADEFLAWLKKTDFFEAPASTRYHMSCKGGLCAHSLNVYFRLKMLAETEEKVKPSDESIVICGLLHDVCKVHYYTIEMRNVKRDGTWIQEPFYSVNEELPYGHGEKSVYIVNGFFKLSREEAMAINWHMGWSDHRVNGGSMAIGPAFKKFPLAVLLWIADVQATYIDENSELVSEED